MKEIQDIETLLTALYVVVDDHVIPREGKQPGRPKQLTDAELVCLAVAQHLLQVKGERRWVRYARKNLRHLFPFIPRQSGYHVRAKRAATLVCRAQLYLASLCPSWTDEVRLIDGTPIPCGTSRETVKRSGLAGEAGYGFCAAHSRFYWGLKLYLVTTLEGIPVAWCLAHPKLGEAEVAAELLAWAREGKTLPETVFLIGDKGFDGREWHRAMGELDIAFARPDKKNEQFKHGSLGGIRQRIEAIIDTLKDQLTLEEHGGRTTEGVFARIAARILALTAAIWNNWRTGQPVLRSLTAYDH